MSTLEMLLIYCYSREK